MAVMGTQPGFQLALRHAATRGELLFPLAIREYIQAPPYTLGRDAPIHPVRIRPRKYQWQEC